MQAYYTDVSCSQTLRIMHLEVSFMGKKLYLKISRTPGFQLHKIQQNSCCCGVLGYSYLKPQLRLEWNGCTIE